MIESENLENMFRYVNWRTIITSHGVIETLGKSRGTQKIKYTEYIHVLSLHECKIISSISKKI